MNKQFTEQKITAHKLYVLGFSHSEILLKLEMDFEKSVSSRTLSYWIKYFKGLKHDQDYLDNPFELHKIGDHGLPWESGDYLCDMSYELARKPIVSMQMTHGKLDNDLTFIPTIREAKWWWRIHLLAKDDFNYSDVYLMSINYVDREILSNITDTNANYSDLDGFMTYKPWRDQMRGNEYGEATTLGKLATISESSHTGSLIRPDIPEYIIKMWTQPVEAESYKYFTPSKALYLNYLISLVANRDVNQPNDLYSNISLNNLHDIFSNEELNEIPIKAKEAINRIKWWQSQEESMTNVD